MNTTRLKTFATEARNTLRRGVMNRLLALGFDQDGNVVQEPIMFEGGAVFMGETISEDFYNKWISLRDRIASHSLREVLEEAAYTWFNRFLAIRIMQKNSLIDPVLDYRSESVRLPILLTNAQAGNIPKLPDEDHKRLRELLNDPTRTAEQFAILITAFCHNTPVINACFGKLADYTELLLPKDILEENGFLDKLNNTDFIENDDYKSPELIGWLYQFYISERKDEVFAKKGKYEPDEIPAATQIFTPNWIVKYMVQNTVGRIYLDNNPYEDELKSKWKYLVEPSSPSKIEGAGGSMKDILEINSLEELKVADLACGSGHILNECFDLLLDLYVNEGYNRRQAIESIFENNLTGIDIDTRAKQLTTFALLLKACQKDKSFVDTHAMPHVLDIPDVDRYTWRDLNGHMTCALQIQKYNERVFKELDECFTLMEHANSLGSIMKFDISPETREFIILCLTEQKRQQKFVESFADMFRGFEIILALTEKYSALVMNPPYMGGNRFDNCLAKYVKDNYEIGKADLFAVFMMLAESATMEKGKYAIINLPSWLFLTTFEQIRKGIIETQHIDSLLHMGRGIFGIDWGSVAFIVSKCHNSAKGVYFRLHKRNFQHIYYYHIEQLFINAKENHSFKFDFDSYRDDNGVNTNISHNEKGLLLYYSANQKDFRIIPGSPIAYWVSNNFINNFAHGSIRNISEVITGMTIGDNNKYLRLWQEVDSKRIALNKKQMSDVNLSQTYWLPYSKGGIRRQWYGNYEYLVNWSKKDKFNRSKTTLSRLYLKEAITWPFVASGTFSCRFLPAGSLWDVAGSPCFFNDSTTEFYTLGYLASKVANYILSVTNPTINVQAVDINNLPYIDVENDVKRSIVETVNQNVLYSKEDWDAHETSWDFQRNEIIAIDETTFYDIVNDYCDYHHCNLDLSQPEPHKIEWRVDWYKTKWETIFERLHSNEEELNRQFINIYGLQDELTPDVPLDEVTILQQGEITIEEGELKWHDDVLIKQLISYAVGCWMGRYRLDKTGPHIAHTDATSEEIAPYEYNGEPFEIDDDGIIPLMPKDCMFHDNAAQRLADFVRQVFGASTQIENLNFIEGALGMTVEQYFIKQFWKDHKKMYQNRPIYWLFSSKKGAFQCLAYMHRMDAYTVERVRQKYLLPHMEDLRRRIAELAERAASLNTQERKTLESLNKQLDECMEYHDRLHPVADKQIAFDLDDGVVVNYAKFGDILAKIK